MLGAVRRVPRTAAVAAAAVLALLLALWLAHGGAAAWLEALVGRWQNALAAHLDAPGALAGWRLYAVAFGGGLAASLSPCILGMLPVNLSYIGAAGARTRGRAAAIAGAFVAGVALVNVAIGLLSSLFFAVVIEYRAPINIAVGLLTIAMGAWLAGLIRIPTPQVATRMPAGAGPFVVGVVFALVASPCASPVLVAVLAAATRDGSALHAALAMTSYSLGYTLVLFLASLFAGLAVASRKLLAYGGTITRVGAGALVVLGVATVAYGISLR